MKGTLLSLLTVSAAMGSLAHAQSVEPMRPDATPPADLRLATPVARQQTPEPPAKDEHAFSLTPSGFLQVDSVLLSQASVDEIDPGSGEPLNEERFVLRRARVRLDGSYGYARGTVQLDANTLRGGMLRLLAAEMAIGYPHPPERVFIEAALGLFLLPFGFETWEMANRRMFLEPATWVDALFPGRRDLGARLQGAWSFVRYALAVTNGNPSASAQLPLRDPNRAKDYLGRVGAEGELSAGVTLRSGVSALFGTGFHPGRRPTKDSTVVRDSNEDGIVQPSEVQLVSGDPGEPSQNFDRYALGADLSVDYTLPSLGKGRIYAELVWAKNLDRALFVADPVAQGRAARELGSMAAFRQQLTTHAEIGVRYDRYDPDRDARERRGVRVVPYDNSVSTWALAAAWTTLPHVRVTLEYDRQQNPFGRTRAGLPTTLAADVLTLRGQLDL